MSEVTVKIIIPSNGRAKLITTHNYIINAIVCVAESELAEYKEHNPEVEYVTHPDSVIGIANKRQWIYDKFHNVFMMDDDLKGLKNLTSRKGEKGSIAPDQAYWIIQSTANIAKLSGCYLFGYNNFVRPEHYHGQVPFSLTGYINGAGLGMLKGATKLFFNDSIKASQDYWLTGLNAHYYRKAFIDRRFCIYQSSFGDTIGGCSDVRTNQAEEEDFKLLEMYFGDAIQLKKQTNTQLKHQFSKSIRIPF